MIDQEKTLIYLTVGHNINYVKLLALCLQSIRNHGKYDGDILVCVPKEEKFQKEIRNLQQEVLYHLYDCPSMEASAIMKLQIFEYPNIRTYKRVLYIDNDILIINSLQGILSLPCEKINVSSDDPWSFMTQPYWGGDLFDEVDKQKIISDRICGLNSGVFYFAVSNKNNEVFESACNLIRRNPQVCNACLEQPAFNWALLKSGNYDRALQPFIVHRNREDDFSHIDVSSIKRYRDIGRVALHFCGGPGNFEWKYREMIKVGEILCKC